MAEFVERLRPAGQPIGRIDQLVPVALRDIGEVDIDPEFAADTNCAAAVTISSYCRARGPAER